MRQTFFYALNFAAVVNSGALGVTLNIDPEADFVVQALHLSANVNGAFVSRSNIVGIDTTAGNDNEGKFIQEALTTRPKLYRDGGNNLATHSSAGLSHLELAFEQSGKLWQNTPIRADLICGEPGRLFLFADDILLPASSTLTVTLYNKLPASVGGIATPTVDAQLVLVGAKIRK